jgi:hypothetical protein
MPERSPVRVEADSMSDQLEPGPLIATGRAADVFAYGDGLVLRRYRKIGRAHV